MARGRPSKKGLIASAASNLFRVSGYQGTSIDQVVVEAGVSKPTVYSNFPSKLLLWQEVLSLLIASSEQELQALTDELERSNVRFTEGWVSLWQTWVTNQDRLAAYRIHWGEQHKLTGAEQDLFRSLEALLIHHLKRWMSHFSIAESKFFTLMAVSREACLIPCLAAKTSETVVLSDQIESLLSA